MKAISIEDIKGIISDISILMDKNRDELIRLDGAVGDGDLGLTMSKGFRAMANEAAVTTENDIGKMLMKLGMVMAKTVPSTMGTLVATGFMTGGKAVIGLDSLDSMQFSKFFSAFVEGIMQRGKSKPGEKTLIDVIYPAAEALRQASGSEQDLAKCMQPFYAAAKRGYEDSKQLVAIHGRIAYYGEQSRGKEDPGAAAALLIVQGIKNYIEGHA